jgi:proliferating cell nuclear antigen PCNA
LKNVLNSNLQILLMKITIANKNKKDLFVSIFQVLKNCTSLVNVIFETDRLHIQGMDKSHVCLFDVNIQKKWFDEYSVEEKTTVSFDSSIFHLIISTKQESHDIIIHKTDEDNLNIDLVSKEHAKGEFNKYFKISLTDYEYVLMDVPEVDYDAEFSISSKKICEIVSQMMTFGTDINIKCSEEKIDLITNGITGEMLVNIPIEDLTEYGIVEGEEINLSYSLNYIHKMCLTNKISNEINFYISGEYPMKLQYDLGDDSHFIFFIAPKISDD